MFENCAAFNQDISGWDTSAVTNMHRLFAGADAFNQDISGWNTGAVTDMSYMFDNATVFDQPIGVWDTSAVTTMEGMFNSALAFNQDISAWVTSSVTNMADMFSNAQAFNQPVNAWDTSAVTDMSFTFNDTVAFNQPLADWSTGLVTDMNYMFAGSLFNQNISGWCVPLIPLVPFNFATGGALAVPFYPVWGTCPATSPLLLYASFTSATTTTDLIPPPLTPTVTIPASTTLTFGATEATFNTLSNPGAFPTVVYGTIGAASKLSPATYPTDSLFISAYIDLTGINNGSIAATTVSEFLKVVYQGNGSGSNELNFGVYLQLSDLVIKTIAQVVPLASNVALEAPGPTSGVHEYSIEWTPDGGAIFRLDDEIVRYSLGATRPTTDFGITVTASGPNYGGASPGGIYESTVRDVSYIYTPYVPTYAFTNTINNGLYLSNIGRTISTPNGSYGVITSVDLSGKVYCEFEAVSSPGTGMFNAFGVYIDNPTTAFNFANANGSFIYSRDTFAAGCGASGAGIWINGTESPNTAYEFTYGDRIGIAFDAATQQMWVSINGSYVSGDPAAGTSPSATLTATGPFRFAMSNYDCASPAGSYVYTMYPSGATLAYAPPVGFTAYDPN
jgi:surface protein